ncbi:hypothetical protein CcaCcLH18_10333 [Colletotrichum camelliae]|nr:hypothetical protein CcaCcLH18_10333 [Colletotrichum camelliae]
MQQDEHADPGTYDDGDNNDVGLKLGTNEAYDDDTMNAHASADEDDELPEDWLLALGQWASRICYVFDTASDAIGGPHGMLLRFYLYDDEGQLPRESIEYSFENMEFYAAKGLCLGPEFLDPSLNSSTAKSDASIDLVRSWYQQCTCRNWQPESRVLPTRLVQDCKEDWALRESKTMGNVYQYGELNIAATGYDDGDKGLFCMRDPIPSNQFPIHLDFELRGEQGERSTVNGFYIKARGRGFVDDVIRGPLNSRGWVAQERALSPAIVHYTPKVIWWECGCMIANEALPGGQAEWDPYREYTPWQVRSLGVAEKESIYEFWKRFIGFYAATKITFEKDRFPAATGIARILGKMLNERFIAGFWEGDIARSLLWGCYGVASIPSAQVAPSWSWASMPQKLSPPYLDVPDNVA